MKRVLIDADGCPVVDETIRQAKCHKIPCILLCDTSHIFNRTDVEIITVSKGADSVDFRLVNLVQPGDLVITQDYGLAAMCLAKGGRVLHQDGMEYTADNIDSLLMARHTAKKVRNAGGRFKAIPKRTAAQDTAFSDALAKILNETE